VKKILCMLVLAACGARSHGQSLHDAVTNYHDGIRWDRLTAAAIQVPPKEREDFMDQRDELGENLKVSDWEIEKVRLEGADHARVQVKLTWYADDEGVVHETQAVERWERHGKVWWITDEHRSRGPAMPGLAEAM
jgi:hypothetical protein